MAYDVVINGGRIVDGTGRRHSTGMSRSTMDGLSPSVRSMARPTERLTPPGTSSRPGSLTPTPITTPSCCGIRRRTHLPRMGSPRS